MANSVAAAGGTLLYYSGASLNVINGTSAAQTLTGTIKNDGISGYGGGDTLVGGAGDDIYYLYSPRDVVVEQAAQGVDTVQTGSSYTLGANLENLVLWSTQTYGYGNAAANIITGTGGSQTIDGGAGNDVLFGGAGADIFIIKPGDGRDVIGDFQAGVDRLQLPGFGLTSFAQVQAATVQTGPDVVLSMPTGEQAIFRNHVRSDFSAKDFQLSLDTSKLKLSFDDEFNSLSLHSQGGTWWTSFGSGGGLINHTLSRNSELEVYVDPTFTGSGTTPLGVNPFSVHNGVVDITAAKASAAVSGKIWGYQYTSGMLSTKTTFAQLYGYFEVRAKLPAGQGMWPAFWMVPAGGGTAELDVMEQLGSDPKTIYVTKHSQATGVATQQGDIVHTADSSTGYHTYGLLWDKTDLVWYVDGTEVDRMSTPADANVPMYMVLNLAVGGWKGAPDPSKFPGTMSIDYVRAYSLGSSATPTPTPPPPTSIPTIPGTAASESFSLKLSDLSATASGVQRAYSAFGGAGGWFASDNDFLALSGFSAGSTFTWDHDDPTNAKIGTYRVHDAASGHDYLISIQSTDGAHLKAGDFNFY